MAHLKPVWVRFCPLKPKVPQLEHSHNRKRHAIHANLVWGDSAELPSQMSVSRTAEHRENLLSWSCTFLCQGLTDTPAANVLSLKHPHCSHGSLSFCYPPALWYLPTFSWSGDHCNSSCSLCNHSLTSIIQHYFGCLLSCLLPSS